MCDLIFNCGNGKNVSFWLDVSFGNISLASVYPELFVMAYIAQTLLLRSRVVFETCPTRVSDTRVVCIFKILPCIHVSCPFQHWRVLQHRLWLKIKKMVQLFSQYKMVDGVRNWNIQFINVVAMSLVPKWISCVFLILIIGLRKMQFLKIGFCFFL